MRLYLILTCIITASANSSFCTLSRYFYTLYLGHSMPTRPSQSRKKIRRFRMIVNTQLMTKCTNETFFHRYSIQYRIESIISQTPFEWKNISIVKDYNHIPERLIGLSS